MERTECWEVEWEVESLNNIIWRPFSTCISLESAKATVKNLKEKEKEKFGKNFEFRIKHVITTSEIIEAE